MFNFFYQFATKNFFLNKQTLNPWLFSGKLAKTNKPLIFFNKNLTFLPQYLNTTTFTQLVFISKKNNWPVYINIVQKFLIRYLHFLRFKWYVIYSCVSLVFLSSTILLKQIFKLIVFLLPLHKHKKILFKLLRFFKKLLNFFELNSLQTQIFFIFKGKLSQRGDSKKKKHKINMFSVKNTTNRPYYITDGVGQTAMFGYTFFRIKYTKLTKKSKLCKL